MKAKWNVSAGFKQLKIARWKVELKEKKHENVKLKEEDMPGAILPQEKPEECTVKQLQGWLLCHEAKTTRKKTQLIQRKACTDLEVPEVICTQKTQQLVCLVTFKVAVLAQSGSKATAKRQIICKTQHLYCTRHSFILITFDCIIPRFRAWAQSISVLFT